jgi:hypothetical protein
MKQLVSILLVSLLVAPLFLSGCCNDDGMGKMRQQYGDK